MKKQLLFCCLATLGLNAMQAQNFNEWKDPEVIRKPLDNAH